MTNFRKLAAYIAGLLAVFMLAGPAMAGIQQPRPDITFSNLVVDCSSVEFTATLNESGSTDIFVAAQTVPDGQLLAVNDIQVSAGPNTVSFNFPEVDSGTIIDVSVFFGFIETVPGAPVTVNCEEPPAESACADGRLNTNLCEPVAIYPIFTSDADVPGLSIWGTRVDRIDNNPGGEFLFFVPGAELQDLPDNPEESILIEESDDGFARLYKLPDGQFLVQAGPDFEGKVFNFYFDDLASGNVPTITTFFP